MSIDQKMDDFEQLRADLVQELDERAERDDAFWHAQRHAIQRRLRQGERQDERHSERHEPRPSRTRRPVWALAGLGTAAAGALVAAVLLLFPHALVSPTGPPSHSAEVGIDPETAALLRSVEITLSSDVASPLSAADVLLAEMEAEFALLETGPTSD